MASAYKIKKKAIGGYSVLYDCPHCSTGLTSSLNEAGTSQPCPTCNKPFVVPGKADLEQLKAKQDLERRAKELEDRERARQRQVLEEDERNEQARIRAEEEARQLFRDSHCPYCWEEIQPGVKKCKHCHEVLDPELRERAAKQEVIGVNMTLEQTFWMVAKFWLASLVFGVVLAGIGFIAVALMGALAGLGGWSLTR